MGEHIAALFAVHQAYYFIIGFFVILCIVIAHARRIDRIHEIDGKPYVVSRISKERVSFEYRCCESFDWLISRNDRGDVRVFKEGESVRAISLRAECTPTGYLWHREYGDARDARPDEVAMFEMVFR